MRNWILTALLLVVLTAGACAGGDSSGFAEYRVLDEVHADEPISVYVLAAGGRLLVYVAQIDYQTGWPTDRLYAIDPATGTMQSETGLVHAAVNESLRYMTLNRISAAEDWPETIDTVVWPGVDYADFEYWLDDGGEEIAIPYVTMYDLKTVQPVRNWFPAGGYALWATDETVVLCMASWGTLRQDGFTAEQAWFRSGAPDFAKALRSVPPVPDTTEFMRYPQEPWEEATTVSEWRTDRGVLSTRAPLDTETTAEYWSKAAVVSKADGDTSVITAGRLVAANAAGDDIVVERVQSDMLQIVWLRRGAAQ